jgi:hypothetical protein
VAANPAARKTKRPLGSERPVNESSGIEAVESGRHDSSFSSGREQVRVQAHIHMQQHMHVQAAPHAKRRATLAVVRARLLNAVDGIGLIKPKEVWFGSQALEKAARDATIVLNYRLYEWNGVDGDCTSIGVAARTSCAEKRRRDFFGTAHHHSSIAEPSRSSPKKESGPSRHYAVCAPPRRPTDVVFVPFSVKSVQSSVVQTLWNIPSVFPEPTRA